MNKRFHCLWLCLVLILGTVLVGCNSEDEGNDPVVNKNATTVTLAMSKGEGTTDEAAQMIEDAINVITESKLNTHVELMLFEEDQLKQAILDKVDDIGSRLQAGEEAAADTVEEDATDVVIVDEESGREHTQYPEVSSTQFDIVLIRGVEEYYEYMNRAVYVDGDEETGFLAELSPSVLISQYVNSTLLSNAKPTYDTAGVYAIPNNRDFGKYTYLVVNKELAKRYGYQPENLAAHHEETVASGYLTSLECVLPFLTAVHNDNPSMRLVAGMPVFESNHYTFSGVTIKDGNTTINGSDLMIGGNYYLSRNQPVRIEIPPKNLYASSSVQSYYRLMHQLRQWGQTPTEDAVDLSSDFALAYVQGNANTIADIDTDKYYVAVTQNPYKTNENFYGSMYGVTKYSINVARAQEVVELFNTNKEFRNLMYYGIRDVHYTVNEQGLCERRNNGWNMNIYDTGNLFLLEPSTDFDEYYASLCKNSWEAGKALNRDSIDSPLLGFACRMTPELEKALVSLAQKQAGWTQRLLNYPGDNISSEISAIKDELDQSDEFKMINERKSDTGEDPEAGNKSGSVYEQFRAWITALTEPR